MQSKYLVVLDKQEEGVTKSISEITLQIDNLKKLKDSYKFGADGLRLRKLPCKLYS